MRKQQRQGGHERNAVTQNAKEPKVDGVLKCAAQADSWGQDGRGALFPFDQGR